MPDVHESLACSIERHYASLGWRAERADDGTVRASGLGGVTWIGLPVTSADLADASFEIRLRELGSERMPDGRLCPLELLPAGECASELRAVLRRLRLDERGHVEVYSSAA